MADIDFVDNANEGLSDKNGVVKMGGESSMVGAK